MSVPIYLAGPEVFLPDAGAIMSEKRRLARAHGFEPTGPGSDEGGLPAGQHSAEAILARNEEAMRQATTCLANITPFRGISADPGTVCEIGFMLALGRKVWAYSNDPQDYADRVVAKWYGGAVLAGNRGPDGVMVESHSLSDNLMIAAGITIRGGEVLRASKPVADPARELSVFEKALLRLKNIAAH